MAGPADFLAQLNKHIETAQRTMRLATKTAALVQETAAIMEQSARRPLRVSQDPPAGYTANTDSAGNANEPRSWESEWDEILDKAGQVIGRTRRAQ